MSNDALRMLTGYPEWFYLMVANDKNGENRTWAPPDDWLARGGWLALHAGAHIGGSTSKKGQKEALDRTIFTAWYAGGLGDYIETEPEIYGAGLLDAADIPHRRVVGVQRVGRVWLPEWGTATEKDGLWTVEVNALGRDNGCPGSPWWMCHEDKKTGEIRPQYFWERTEIYPLPGLPRLQAGVLGLVSIAPGLLAEIRAQFALVRKHGPEKAAEIMGVSLDWKWGRWREITASLTGWTGEPQAPVEPPPREEEPPPAAPAPRVDHRADLQRRAALPVVGSCTCCSRSAVARCQRCAQQVALSTCRCACSDGPDIPVSAQQRAGRAQRGGRGGGPQQVALALPGFGSGSKP